MHVRERENVYVTECVCVFSMTTIPCVCMHVFVKKKKMEKNLKNKCFICFKGTCKQASRSGGGCSGHTVVSPVCAWFGVKKVGLTGSPLLAPCLRVDILDTP